MLMTRSYVTYMVTGLLIVTIVAGACREGDSWSSGEKQNYSHYISSSKASIAAVKLSNQSQAFRELSPEVVAEMLRLMKVALQEARLVADSVLEKAFVGLSTPYRQLYQRSLELQIMNLESGDLAAAIKGSRLHDEWVDWIVPRQQQIRVPR